MIRLKAAARTFQADIKRELEIQIKISKIGILKKELLEYAQLKLNELSFKDIDLANSYFSLTYSTKFNNEISLIKEDFIQKNKESLKEICSKYATEYSYYEKNKEQILRSFFCLIIHENIHKFEEYSLQDLIYFERIFDEFHFEVNPEDIINYDFSPFKSNLEDSILSMEDSFKYVNEILEKENKTTQEKESLKNNMIYLNQRNKLVENTLNDLEYIFSFIKEKALEKATLNQSNSF